ncbi:MAG TPA: PilN domain-containing protein [Gammaproteobacteria bacterium]|nr:PilN domain-containing protein [Gammaproteobacteria bacterium]
MTCINLLPWREMQRKERRRQFASVAFGAVVLMGAIVLYVHMHMDGLIDHQQGRNAFLQKQIKQVDAQIKEIKDLESQRKKLLARMNIIQQLQSNRPQIVHLFDEMVKTLPDGVYLTRMKQSGNSLEVKGAAQSNARVSAFMRNLDASKWLTKPRLDVIQADKTKQEKARVSKFTLQVKQIAPDDKVRDKSEKKK